MTYSTRRSALITGSEGFLGQHLKSKLNKLNWDVTCWDVKVWSRDVQQVANFDRRVDVVFHLAGVTREENFVNDLINSYDINICGTQAVLNYCKKANSKCVFASTSGVYKTSNALRKVDESFQVMPSRPYSISKFIAENLCRHFAEDLNVPSISLRIFNVFGEGQKEPFLVPYVINRLIKGKSVALRMPEAIRDFVYVEDVIDAMIKAGNHNNKTFGLYNIGTGIPTRIIDFLHVAEEIFEKKTKVKIVGAKPGELHSMVANNSKAIRELGWKANFDLQAGLLSMKHSIEKNGSLI